MCEIRADFNIHFVFLLFQDIIPIDDDEGGGGGGGGGGELHPYRLAIMEEEEPFSSRALTSASAPRFDEYSKTLTGPLADGILFVVLAVVILTVGINQGCLDRKRKSPVQIRRCYSLVLVLSYTSVVMVLGKLINWILNTTYTLFWQCFLFRFIVRGLGCNSISFIPREDE